MLQVWESRSVASKMRGQRVTFIGSAHPCVCLQSQQQRGWGRRMWTQCYLGLPALPHPHSCYHQRKIQGSYSGLQNQNMGWSPETNIYLPSYLYIHKQKLQTGLCVWYVCTNMCKNACPYMGTEVRRVLWMSPAYFSGQHLSVFGAAIKPLLLLPPSLTVLRLEVWVGTPVFLGLSWGSELRLSCWYRRIFLPTELSPQPQERALSNWHTLPYIMMVR